MRRFSAPQKDRWLLRIGRAPGTLQAGATIVILRRRYCAVPFSVLRASCSVIWSPIVGRIRAAPSPSPSFHANRWAPIGPRWSPGPFGATQRCTPGSCCTVYVVRMYLPLLPWPGQMNASPTSRVPWYTLVYLASARTRVTSLGALHRLCADPLPARPGQLQSPNTSSISGNKAGGLVPASTPTPTPTPALSPHHLHPPHVMRLYSASASTDFARMPAP